MVDWAYASEQKCNAWNYQLGNLLEWSQNHEPGDLQAKALSVCEIKSLQNFALLNYNNENLKKIHYRQK